MAVKSYAWQLRLTDTVADTGTVGVPTPGFTDPASYKTDETGFVLDGTVLTPEQASGAWSGGFDKVSVTNSSGRDWNPGETLYVTVPGIPLDPANITDSFTTLEARVTVNEGNITSLTSRVSANERAISALSDRVTALEQAGTGTLSNPDRAREKHASGAPEESPDDHDAEKGHGKKHDKGHDDDDDNGKKHKKHK